MSLKPVKMTQGRSRQSAVLKLAAADATLRQVETDHWLSKPVTKQIDPNSPGTVDNAPYTLGCKRTKSKMSWHLIEMPGFKGEDDCAFAYISDTLAYESRGYESRKAPWRFRVRGNTLAYENDDKKRSMPVLQCVERRGFVTLEWLIDLDKHPEVYEHALDFLGMNSICVDDFSAIAGTRRALFKCSSAFNRELQRKVAQKCRKRPGKAERMAARNAQNAAGLPRQSFRLA